MGRSEYQRLKKTTALWCSRYVRVRDCIEYCRLYGIAPDMMICKCYTCGRVYDIREMDAGHCRSKGSGGHSGLYFNEKYIRAQCTQCNKWHAGRPDEFRQNLAEEYHTTVEAIIDEINYLHHTVTYPKEKLVALKEYFRIEVNMMCKKHGIMKWW